MAILSRTVVRLSHPLAIALIALALVACADTDELLNEAIAAAGAGDHERAAKYFEKASRRGSTRAQLTLGWLYFHGRGVPREEERAVHWWSIAAEAGDMQAQSRLGAAYRDGRGVAPDPELAMHWWRQAAEQGELMARFELGVALENSGADPVEAYVWFELAARAGHIVAARRRDGLAAKLDAAQLAQAQARIDSLTTD